MKRDGLCRVTVSLSPNDFINAGIPSTSSTPEHFAWCVMPFKSEPVDLIFQEAAVNDFYTGRQDQDKFGRWKGLCAMLTTSIPMQIIVLLYFVNPSKMEDYNQGIIPAVIQNHQAVASHYHLPTLNLALEVTTRINRGQFAWENDFKDLHLSPFGHQIYFNSIKRRLKLPGKTS